MKVHFVRHGETVHNVDMVISAGVPGQPLNELGILQSRALAAAFVDLSNPVIFSSPLLRAAQTAREIGEAIQAPVRLADELVETDVGELEGRGDAESFARFNEALDEWYLNQNLHFRIGVTGESAASAVERVRAFLTKVEAELAEDAEVIAVSHQTVLQLALAFLPTNIRPAFAYKRWLANCGVSSISLTNGDIRCLTWDGRTVSNLEGRG